MSKRNTVIVAIVGVVAIAAIALGVIAMNTNLLLAGDYYVKIDNANISKNESAGGVINLKSGEPYLYELEAVNASGDRAEIEFGASRELRQDAFLKLELQPARGVVGWSEVPEEDLPPKVAEALG